ncbi:hypothetical protein EDB89DRAFT_1916597 [Lactarius sanguifluus]|nr:hypothetical protein EDB89DRAFT_1916597 [Lactarius sanguifluus]
MAWLSVLRTAMTASTTTNATYLRWRQQFNQRRLTIATVGQPLGQPVNFLKDSDDMPLPTPNDIDDNSEATDDDDSEATDDNNLEATNDNSEATNDNSDASDGNLDATDDNLDATDDNMDAMGDNSDVTDNAQ